MRYSEPFLPFALLTSCSIVQAVRAQYSELLQDGRPLPPLPNTSSTPMGKTAKPTKNSLPPSMPKNSKHWRLKEASLAVSMRRNMYGVRKAASEPIVDFLDLDSLHSVDVIQPTVMSDGVRWS